MSKFITSFLVLFIAAVSISQAQKARLSEAVRDNINLRIDNQTNTGIVIGLINSEGTTYYSFGVKSLYSKDPVDENSVFEIGSISKAFTGILLANMVVKGKSNLDDPLQKYLPEGVKAPERNGEAIKLYQMSNHTSSLPRLPSNFAPANPSNPYADYSEKQMYDFLNSYELTREIGSQYEYSNYAAGMLGNVLAASQDMSYEELMMAVIAKPLGLKNTAITLSSNMKSNLAMGHSGGVHVANWDLPTLAGAGAIRSTTVDMTKFIAVNMGMKKSKLYPAMQLSHKNSREDGASPIVGLGWHTQVFDGGEIIWHNGGTGGYRAFAGFIKDGSKGVVVLSNSNVSVDDIGIHLLNPKSPLQVIKLSIRVAIKEIIDTYDIDAGVNTYSELKENEPDSYDFSESELNTLGYYYLGKEKIDEAVAVFAMNVSAYPESSNVFDSMGEAFRKQGNKEKSIENYKKSVKLNPGNQGAIDALKELGVDPNDIVEEVIVSENILASYVGKYELVPGFIITITKDGTQLKAQATGQQEFSIFPESDTEFYYKVVDAQLVFKSSEDGITESVTLYQAGQVLPGKKLAD